MKLIITHYNLDLDAIASVWLIKRFLPNWQDAQVKFVPAGETIDKELVDSDPHILHVDTGLGKFDHHSQDDESICAAKLIYQYIKSQKDPQRKWHDEALERICEVVNFYDHFQEVTLPDILADYHIFDANSIIDGWKDIYLDKDEKIIEAGLVMMDAICKQMKDKIWAEEIMETEAIEFTTCWGKAVGFETINDEVVKLAQKKGYQVAVRKDPKKGYVRIKGNPGTDVDLTDICEQLKKKDPQATWYLHPSKKILLNGSIKNPDMRPTKLSLNEIVNIIQSK